MNVDNKKTTLVRYTQNTQRSPASIGVPNTTLSTSYVKHFLSFGFRVQNSVGLAQSNIFNKLIHTKSVVSAIVYNSFIAICSAKVFIRISKTLFDSGTRTACTVSYIK